jgi:hypothetical protein
LPVPIGVRAIDLHMGVYVRCVWKFMPDEILYGFVEKLWYYVTSSTPKYCILLGSVLMHGRLEGFFGSGYCPVTHHSTVPMCGTSPIRIYCGAPYFPKPRLGKQLISTSERRGGKASQGIPHFGGNVNITVPSKYPLLTLTVGFVLFKTKYTQSILTSHL